MSLLKNISEEQFKKLVSESFSKAGVIKKLSLEPRGANYKAFNKLVKKWNVDISHFTGQGHLKNKTHNWAKVIPLSDILVENSNYSSSNKLRKRLIKEGIFEHKCNKCNNITWNNLPIPLELEHKNGINDDNRLENLELLCPNCHAQTDTYRGKNKKQSVKQINTCQCGKEIRKCSKNCKSCAAKQRLTKSPPKHELIHTWNNIKNWTKMGKYYGVSDNAVRKWFKKYSIVLPERNQQIIDNHTES